MRGAVGVAFTTTPHYASQLMGSWLVSGTVFPPQPAPARLDYQPRSRRRTSAHAGRRVRPERPNPHSIATLRTEIARLLFAQLPGCLFVDHARLILSVNFGIDHAGSSAGVVGCCAPGILQQPHATELLQRKTAPVRWRSRRLKSALAFPAVLIAQHPQMPFSIPPQSMRTK